MLVENPHLRSKLHPGIGLPKLPEVVSFPVKVIQVKPKKEKD